jgi:RNA polymerase sigma factor (sigma-70 family)
MGGRKKRRETGLRCRWLGPAAWDLFYRQTYPQVRSWFAARGVTGQEADDLAGELLKSLAQADEPDDLRAYIAAAAANALMRCRRRKARERDFLQRLSQEVTREQRTSHRGAEEASRNEKTSELLAEAEKVLGTLPADEADLLRLRFLEGLPVAEVARRTGCSPEAAYKRLERILKRLRARYAGELPGPAEGKNLQDV